MPCERKHSGSGDPQVNEAEQLHREAGGKQIEECMERIKRRRLRVGSERLSPSRVSAPEGNMAAAEDLAGEGMLRQEIEKHVAHHRNLPAKKHFPKERKDEQQ